MGALLTPEVSPKEPGWWRRSLKGVTSGRKSVPLPAMTPTLSGLTGKTVGRYVIERELGRGGTAIVYLGRGGMGSEPVAIKMLRHELLESLSAEQFLKEIRRTETLDHPRIV